MSKIVDYTHHNYKTYWNERTGKYFKDIAGILQDEALPAKWMVTVRFVTHNVTDSGIMIKLPHPMLAYRARAPIKCP
jgi:hypothetical protein